MADELLSAGWEGGRPDTQGLIRDWPLWVLMAADWTLGLWLLPKIPKLVPLHWGLSGQADGWGSPLSLVLPLPAATVLIYVVLLGVSRWGLDSMSGFHLSAPIRRQLRWLVVTVLSGIHIALLLKSQGQDTGLPRLPFLGLALGFMVAGNLLPRMEPNPLTAPTPERRAEWRTIYRSAGRYLVAAGLFQAVTLWLPSPMLIFTVLGSIILASLDPMIRVARLRAYRPGHGKPAAETHEPLSLFSAYDLLALGGFMGLFLFRLALPIWMWVGVPLLAWALLCGEAILLSNGEVKRTSVQMRGWVVLGLELSLGCHALLVYGQLLPILVGLTALNLCAAVGQGLARKSATPIAQDRWGQGPVLWDPADPRLFAPKGLGLGWTFNFARVASWVLLLGMFGFMYWMAFALER